MSGAGRLELAGAHVALYTPFSTDGSVDVPALRGLCDRVAAAGVGLVPCGTTGETPTLTPSEWETVIATAVEVSAGRVPVVAGTGSNNTATAVASTRRAAELGADAALVSAPAYNKPPQVGLLAHFRAIADDGGLPVVLYNVPGRAACNMTAETTLELAEHPGIVAIKEASADLEQIQRIIFEAPADFRVLSGDDAWTLTIMLLGGHGVVSVAGNVVPQQLQSLVEAAGGGDLATARATFASLLPLFGAIFQTTNPIPIKHAAAMLGHCGSELRLPLTSAALTEPMIATLQAALDRAQGGG